jgi:hypothetical protein
VPANQATAVFADPHVEDHERLEGVEAIGVDEKRFLNATSDHRTVYITQIVDLDRHRLLDVIEGRARAARPPPSAGRVGLTEGRRAGPQGTRRCQRRAGAGRAPTACPRGAPRARSPPLQLCSPGDRQARGT